MPDHDNVGAMFIVRIRDVAAELRLLQADLAHVRRDSQDPHFLQVFGFVLGLDQAPLPEPHVPGQAHVVAHEFVVFPGHFPVAALEFKEFLLAGGNGVLDHQKNVGSEVSNAVGNVLVAAGDQRDHQQQRANRKNHAQQREKRPQLMRAQGVQRNQRRLFE